jgi:hypothetical protein
LDIQRVFDIFFAMQLSRTQALAIDDLYDLPRRMVTKHSHGQDVTWESLGYVAGTSGRDLSR